MTDTAILVGTDNAQRGRGRPRGNRSTSYKLKVSFAELAAIQGSLAKIRLNRRQLDLPAASVIVEALAGLARE